MSTHTAKIDLTYASKVDLWLLLILAAVPLALLATAILQRSALMAVPLIVVLATYALLVFPVSYRFDASALVVRSGVIRRQIPYAAIVAVRATRNPVSSPALSLDRLAIVHGAAETLISPRDRIGFVRDLSARVQHLQIQM